MDGVMKLRNWIEKAIGVQWINPPVLCGYRSGRSYYAIDWCNGTHGEYYIDFENHIIETIYEGD